jgi:hypothetical protein
MSIITSDLSTISIDLNSLISGGRSQDWNSCGILHAIGGINPPTNTIVNSGIKYFRSYASKIISNASRYNSLGLKIILVLSDGWGYHSPWPGDSGNWSSWETFCVSQVQSVINSGVDLIAIDIWNEPDITNYWNRPLSQAWEAIARASNILHINFPTIKVIGPSLQTFDSTKYQDFFTTCDTFNATMDYIGLHQLSFNDPIDLSNRISIIRGLTSLMGNNNKPLAITEYVAAGLSMINPSHISSWMASFVLNDIKFGTRSVFIEDPIDGGDGGNNGNRDTLGGLLSADYSLRPCWWLYREISNISGKLFGDPNISIVGGLNQSTKEFRAIYSRIDPSYQHTKLTIPNWFNVLNTNSVQVSIRHVAYMNWSRMDNTSLLESNTLSISGDVIVNIPPLTINDAIIIRVWGR